MRYVIICVFIFSYHYLSAQTETISNKKDVNIKANLQNTTTNSSSQNSKGQFQDNKKHNIISPKNEEPVNSNPPNKVEENTKSEIIQHNKRD